MFLHVCWATDNYDQRVHKLVTSQSEELHLVWYTKMKLCLSSFNLLQRQISNMTFSPVIFDAKNLAFQEESLPDYFMICLCNKLFVHDIRK